MRVAVTGGSGFVGRAVVRELAARGHVVTVLSRRPPSAPLPGVRYSRGDVVDGEGLDASLEGCEALVHLVGIIREVPPRQTFDRVHRGGTENALAAAARVGARRYLHMSAMGTRADAASRYHRTKWQAEEAVRASGLDWTIFRPSVVFGPEDAFVNMLEDLVARTPVVPVFGGGRSRMQPVAVGDVARSFAAALERGNTVGKAYELGGPDIVTFRQLLQIIADLAGKKRLFLPVPFWAVRGPLGLLERLRLPTPVSSDQLLMLAEDNVRTGGAPLEDLGFAFTPLLDGLKVYLGSGPAF